MDDPKLLVFLRHYNDIDHVTPVIYKWSARREGPVQVLFASTYDYFDDPRIQFLKTLQNVEVGHLDDFLPTAMKSFAGRQRKRTAFSRILHGVKARIFGTPPWGPEFIDRTTIGRILSAVFDGGRSGVVAFDWTYTDFARRTIETARKRGLRVVSLPHGDRPYVNRMIETKHLDMKSTEIAFQDMYDCSIIPNKNYEEIFTHRVGAGQVRILGSPRFNAEWIAKLDRIIPPFDGVSAGGRLNVVMFLRSKAYSVFWEEVLRTVLMLSRFPRLRLVVKPHTRDDFRLSTNILDHQEVSVRDLPNVEIAGPDVHANALIRWADVVLDLGTTVSFEAIQRGKPVLELEYLHANRSTIAHRLSCTDMQCRDDLYLKMAAFLSEGTSGFYDEGARSRFVDDLIHFPDEKVLDRYVDCLRSRA